MEKKVVYMLEDDSDDRYITESMIEELRLPIQIKYFISSDQFLEFLSSAEKAFLILINYNSKPDNAEKLLKKIKDHANHRGTPVIVLSDSVVAKYKEECYALGASSFIQKPSKMNRTKEMIDVFFSYWLTISGVSLKDEVVPI